MSGILLKCFSLNIIFFSKFLHLRELLKATLCSNFPVYTLYITTVEIIMKRTFTLCLGIVLVAICSSTAQNEARNWFFGERVGLTINQDDQVLIPNVQLYYSEGASSISDCTGSLLFYTDGQDVWNRNQQKMPNGQGLAGHYSSTQGSIIIPLPASCSLYYIFTLDGKEHYLANGLQYSIVDMEADNGLGDVITKNVPVYTPSSEKMTAVRHTDGQSVWIITHEMQTSGFRAYLLTPSGLNPTPVISETGIVFSSVLNALGQMKASPDGTRLAFASLYPHLVQIFDFDASTGIVSHPISIGGHVMQADGGVYGLEFSPDSRLLYFTNHTLDYLNKPGYLYQVDLSAGSETDIINSTTKVGENVPLTDMRGLQLGPDGRLYVSTSLSKFLAVVNHPNQLGTACDYDNFGVSLGNKTAGWTLPNFMTSFFNQLTTGPVSADFQIFSNENCIEEPIRLEFTGQGHPQGYYWDFGDGTEAHVASPNHIFRDTGTHTITMIALNGCCSDTIQKEISLIDCNTRLFIPNAFSPNGDGINDVLNTFGSGIQTYQIAIYSRWGEQVFASGNWQNRWDGHFRGKPANPGDYVYIAEVQFQNGVTRHFKGEITLIR